MRGKTIVCTGLALAAVGALPLRAEKLSKEFRAAFEQAYAPRTTWAVVVQKGIPTTSIYGTEGNQSMAHYSIDIVDGSWKTSAGLLDTDQQAVDFLSVGEILDLDSISYKDNRMDIRMVSTEAHQVTRGGWLLSDRKPEPVATNFKFFLPFPKERLLTAADMPEVTAYIEKFVRVFPDKDSARAFAARLLTGQADTAQRPASSAPAATGSATATTSKKEIQAGMTPLQVIEILGRPEKELTFGNTVKWTYPDLTVIFEDGRVKEVRF